MISYTHIRIQVFLVTLRKRGTSSVQLAIYLSGDGKFLRKRQRESAALSLIYAVISLI